MAQSLPTKEQLEALYQDKGKEALVWYAWRNAMRALPLLGYLPLEKVWKEELPENVFNVCRVALLLANGSKAEFFAYAADAAADAARASIISDYQFLLSDAFSPQTHWFSQPLWCSQPPDSFLSYKETLFKQLKALDLDFLADDLSTLFSLQGDSSASTPEHWQNYARKFSSVELNDPKTLRALILGETESAEINAVRVILLGPGGAGKTTLLKNLLGELDNDSSTTTDATIGIVCEDLSFPEADQANLSLVAWDFGGQTLFYGMHRSFLHENCVYVLVVDGRHEQSPDNWLYQIRHLAESKRPAVMLVSNTYENCQYQHNQQRLQRLFGDSLDLHFYGFACNNPNAKGLHPFKDDLLKLAKASRHLVSKNLLDKSTQLDRLFKNQPIKSRQSLLQQLNNGTDEGLIEKLKGLGYLVALDSASERLCIDSNWLIDHAYQLLFYPCLTQADSLGLVSHSGLRNTADDEGLTALDDLLQFLVNSGLCVRLDEQYFFPDLAAFNEPVYLPAVTDCVILELQFPYLPIGLFARMVSHWMQQASPCRIEKYDYVWRSGFVLTHVEAPLEIEENHYKQGSGIWLEYLTGQSLIRLHGFGDSRHIAELFLHFWQGLVNLKIEPLKQTDILPLLAVDQRFMSDTQGDALKNACLWMQDIDEIKRVFKQIEESSKVAKVEFNNSVVNGVQTGSKANMTNTFNQGETGLGKEQLELILGAIKEIKNNQSNLTDVQSKELASLAEQVENNEIVPIYYERLLEVFNTVGSAASIASVVPAISKMLGLS